MKRSLLKLTTVILIFSIAISMMSCMKNTKKVPCDTLIDALVSNEIGLPAGKIYSCQADEGDPEYISESLLCSLYGNGSLPRVCDGWIEYTLFLPTSYHPCEFAVILCDSHDTANDTAKLFCRRLTALKNAKSDQQFATYFENARIVINKNYVFFIISSDTPAAVKLLSSVIS